MFFLLFASLSLPYTPPLLLYHRYISKHISKVRALEWRSREFRKEIVVVVVASFLSALLIPFGLTRFLVSRSHRNPIILHTHTHIYAVCAFIWSMKSEFSIVRIKFPRLSRHCTMRGFFFYVVFCSALYICFPFHSRTDDGSGRWARARERERSPRCSCVSIILIFPINIQEKYCKFIDPFFSILYNSTAMRW